MDYLIARIIYSIIGRICLYIRYWKTGKVKQILRDDYENSFTDAGRILSLNFVIFLFLLGIIGLLISPLIHFIKGL